MEERRILQQEILDILKDVQTQTNGGFDKRLTKLEVRFDERWDKVLYEMHQYSKQWAKIEDRLDTLPCSSHKEKFKVYDDHIEDGKFWRRFMVGQAVILVVALLGSVLTGGYMMGKLEQRLEDHIGGAVCEIKNTN